MGSFTHVGGRIAPKHGSNAPAESTREIDDETNYQNQTEAAAANRRSAEVKSAATEQEQKNEDE
jgi:hypothetical protein